MFSLVFRSLVIQRGVSVLSFLRLFAIVRDTSPALQRGVQGTRTSMFLTRLFFSQKLGGELHHGVAVGNDAAMLASGQRTFMGFPADVRGAALPHPRAGLEITRKINAMFFQVHPAITKFGEQLATTFASLFCQGHD